VYGGILEIFSLHRQPASIKHKHQQYHIAASSDTNNECLPDAIVNLPNTTYPGSQLIIVGSPYVPSWRSKHTTVASQNGSDITCEITTSHISTHPTKSSSSGCTRASISGPLSAAYSRLTTCRGELNTYQPRSSGVPVLSSSQPAQHTVWRSPSTALQVYPRHPKIAWTTTPRNCSSGQL
jgi:hypothetical protein